MTTDQQPTTAPAKPTDEERLDQMCPPARSLEARNAARALLIELDQGPIR